MLRYVLCILVLLTGCAVVPCAEDSGSPAVVDGGVAPALYPGIDALTASSIVGTYQQAGIATGQLDIGCIAPPTPFPYDTTGRVTVRCDPQAVADCVNALSRANHCEAFREAWMACDGSSCR